MRRIIFSEGNFKQDGEAAGGGIGEVEAMIFAVELLQSVAREREPPPAVSIARRRGRRTPNAVITNR